MAFEYTVSSEFWSEFVDCLERLRLLPFQGDTIFDTKYSALQKCVWNMHAQF